MIRKARNTPRSLVVILAALVFLVAACGSDDDTDTAADESPDAATTTQAEAAEDDVTEATEASGDAEAVDGLPIELGEWFVSEPVGITAGSTTFALMNVGENPHAFAIARGTSYEDLPQKDNGAVDQEALGDDFLGSADNIDPGGSGSITFDLEPGDYVFFCPIEFGPNSHAAAGQVLSVTIG